MTKKYVPLSFTSSGGEGGSGQTLNIDSSFTVVASDNVAGTNRVGYTISDSNDQNTLANIEVGTLYTKGAGSVITSGNLATAMYNEDSEGNIVSPYVQPEYDEETGEWISNEDDRVDANPDEALESVQISTSQIQMQFIDPEALVEVHTRITPRGFEIDYADSERQVDTTRYYFPLPDGQEHTLSVEGGSGGGSSGSGSTLYEHQITIELPEQGGETATFKMLLPTEVPLNTEELSRDDGMNLEDVLSGLGWNVRNLEFPCTGWTYNSEAVEKLFQYIKFVKSGQVYIPEVHYLELPSYTTGTFRDNGYKVVKDYVVVSPTQIDYNDDSRINEE